MSVWSDLVLIGWLVFWLYWLISALRTAQCGGATGMCRSSGIRVGVLVILLVVYTGVHWNAGISQPLTRSAWILGLGVAVFVFGLALAVWARVYLGANWGMPRTQRSGTGLVTSGPYRWIRHPIYTGILLGALGSALAVSPYWLVALALLGASFAYSAHVEEHNMTVRFPDDYPAYRRRTKRLIPFFF
jgi:protein-S-isoprenylcysteine O-methyltransferase Ste14